MAVDENGNPEQRGAQVPPVEEPEGLPALYANFCRMASTPEELVLDFGLNPPAFGGATQPVKVAQRIVVNYYTAKKLWALLGAALQRHEQLFGAIEIDANKRATPATRPRG